MPLAKPLLVLMLCTAAGLASAATMYRWVDKNGVVQYTQLPPPGSSSESVRPAPPANPGTGGLRKYADQTSKSQAERDKLQSEAAALQQQRDTECGKARTALQKLRSMPLKRLAEQDESGGLVRMTPEKQAELVAEAEKSAAKNCAAE